MSATVWVWHGQVIVVVVWLGGAPAGYFELEREKDGSVEVVFPTESWLPILPSFGVSYSF